MSFDFGRDAEPLAEMIHDLVTRGKDSEVARFVFDTAGYLAEPLWEDA
jgi:hypothetical protein